MFVMDLFLSLRSTNNVEFLAKGNLFIQVTNGFNDFDTSLSNKYHLFFCFPVFTVASSPFYLVSSEN